MKNKILVLVVFVGVVILCTSVSREIRRAFERSKAEARERREALAEVDTLTALLPTNGKVSLLAEASHTAVCELRKRDREVGEAVAKINAIKPPPTEEEKRYFLFNHDGIQEINLVIFREIRKRAVETIKQGLPLGRCGEMGEVEFFEWVLVALEKEDLDPEVARVYFKKLLRTEVTEVKEKARVEFLKDANPSGNTLQPWREQLAKLAQKAEEWNFGFKEVGIEPHLLPEQEYD